MVGLREFFRRRKLFTRLPTANTLRPALLNPKRHTFGSPPPPKRNDTKKPSESIPTDELLPYLALRRPQDQMLRRNHPSRYRQASYSSISLSTRARPRRETKTEALRTIIFQAGSYHATAADQESHKKRTERKRRVSVCSLTAAPSYDGG